MKKEFRATLGRRSWKVKRVKRMREDFAFCDLRTREIHIEEQHEGLFLLTLLIHEALHATFPRKLAKPGLTEEEEERWVERTAIEIAKLIKAADLAAEDVK